MRGCLTIVILAAVFVVAATWFVGPAAAQFVVERALAANGFTGTATTVTVRADPPFELLTGHADAVDIHADHAAVRRLQAASLTVRLTNVDVLGRRFGAVDGRLDGVTLHAADGSTIEADSIRLLGPGNDVTATVRIAGSVVRRLAAEAVRRQLGLTAGDITLVGPDLIRFNVAGIPAEGRFAVDEAGALYVDANFAGSPRLKIVDTGDPLVLRSAVVDGPDVVLVGTLDVAGLLLP